MVGIASLNPAKFAFAIDQKNFNLNVLLIVSGSVESSFSPLLVIPTSLVDLREAQESSKLVQKSIVHVSSPVGESYNIDDSAMFIGNEVPKGSSKILISALKRLSNILAASVANMTKTLGIELPTNTSSSSVKRNDGDLDEVDDELLPIMTLEDLKDMDINVASFKRKVIVLGKFFSYKCKDHRDYLYYQADK
ncbi:hypothetical protein VNO77_30555 [Canavalia gladiata]|uniref:Uncharacterized protein n=1 Tax=Canavalia gladiata TaxID=3824 RepID=A0AAN9KQB8_CANGL